MGKYFKALQIAQIKLFDDSTKDEERKREEESSQALQDLNEKMA